MRRLAAHDAKFGCDSWLGCYEGDEHCASYAAVTAATRLRFDRSAISTRPSWTSVRLPYSTHGIRVAVVDTTQVSGKDFFYLRQGGCVFIGVCLFVCLFVSRIVQKLFNRFSQYSVERWHMGHGRNHILVVIQITLR